MIPEQLNDLEKSYLNRHVEELQVINELRDNDEMLLKGQKDIEERLDKGADRMDGIEEEVRGVKEDVKKLTELMIESNKQRDQQHADLKHTIVNNEISKLKKELKDREQEIETKDSRIWEVSKIIITAILSIAGALYLAGIGIK